MIGRQQNPTSRLERRLEVLQTLDIDSFDFLLTKRPPTEGTSALEPPMSQLGGPVL